MNHPGTYYASLKHLPVIERVHFFQIFYNKRMVRVSFPGNWGTLLSCCGFSPIRLESLWNHWVSFLSGEELWITIFAPLPLGTWRWKEQELLRYSLNSSNHIYQTWAGQDWGDVCAGLEPWVHIQGSQLSFVCQSLKLKSRCPAALTDTSSLGLKPFGKSGRWLWTNGNWVSGGAKSFINKLSFAIREWKKVKKLLQLVKNKNFSYL